MEPADKKSKLIWVRVGSFLSAAFTQTELDSSHLESLKPAQRGAEEDFTKQWEQKEMWERKKKCVLSSGSSPALDCPRVLIPVSPSVSSSAISESINKTWWDGRKTGMDGRERREERWSNGGCCSKPNLFTVSVPVEAAKHRMWPELNR